MTESDAIAGMISRVKVQQSVIAGRTLVQVTGLDEDGHDAIELLLPPGYVAMPIVGSDAVELRIGGAASHKVVIAGDHTEDAVPNLAYGECGLSRGGTWLLIRGGGARTEIITPLLQWGTAESALKRLVTETFMALFNAHTHAGGAVPDQQMTAADLTGGS